jgi:outer membrane protein OmpA-like peptidoglycan-associated protein
MHQYRILFCCLTTMLLSFYPQADSVAQTNTEGSSGSCDCATAVPLVVHEILNYGPAQAPDGFGLLQEIRARSKYSKTAFEQEHHSAWYLLSIQQDGDLTMDIKAIDSTNDYDFLIFPYTDTASCRNIREEKLKAVRGNLSRNLKSQGNTTGLSVESKFDFHEEGPGEQYSKSLTVKKGEQYLLVLDNVHDKGLGHRLSFGIVQDIRIEGVVNNDAGKPVAAEVVLLDGKGTTVSKTNSNAAGEYSLDTKIIPNMQYSLSFSNDSSFVASESINTMFMKGKNDYRQLSTVLPELKKGKKYPMGQILFEGNSAKIVPQSISSLVSLYHLMRRNKKLVIQIEGHINGVSSGLPPHLEQQLSEERAETVYKYLLRKGIEASRLSTIGRSKSQMLYPNPKNFNEQSANRRVEIKVLDF